MLRHFACRFRALRSGILQIWKECQNLENAGIWPFFQIWNIPLLSAPKWLAKWLNLFHLGVHTQILTVLAGKCWNTLHADLEHLKVEYCKSENSARILRTAGIWHFFSDLKYSTLSVSKWLAKWVDMLHPGTHTRILTALGQKMLRHFACNFGAFRNGILQIWKKC
jgi:hypothetical protein